MGVNGITAYRGLLPFGDSAADQALFCGRDTEAEQLASQIAASPIVLLFSRSGLGKTSIVNASVVPRLRQRNYLPIVVRLTGSSLGGDGAGHDGTADVCKRLLGEIEHSVEAAGAHMEGDQDHGSLWAFFCTTQFRVDARLVRPVLILDQFEEVFSGVSPETKPDFRKDFIDLLSDFARNRPPEELRKDAESRIEQASSEAERQKLIRIAFGEVGHDAKLVLVIREEYLPQLEELKSHIPGIFRTTSRLLPLTPAEAREAIIVPAQRVGELGGQGFSYDDAAVDQIINFLQIKIVNGRDVPGDSIEPMQLQMLCSDLERRCIAAKKSRITVDDLGGVKGMRRVIDDYYKHVIEGLPNMRSGWNGRRYRISRSNWWLFNLPRAAARFLCEHELITPFGQRNSIQQDVIGVQVGIPSDDLRYMVESYLLRTDRRLDTEFYELSHDSLVGTLLDNRRQRWRRGRLALAALALLIAFPGVIVGSRLVRDRIVALQIPRALEYVGSNPTDRARLARTIRWLGTAQPQISFPARMTVAGTADNRIDLRGFDPVAPRFLKPAFSYVDFDGSDLSQSVVSGATIENTSFAGADLEFTYFGGSSIASTSFRNARLYRSNFNYVAFGDGVDFSGADLLGASFYRASFDRGMPIFSDVAWWLAYGWSGAQIDALEAKFPRSAYLDSAAFVSQRKQLETAVQKAAANSVARADALNELAWMLAIRGADLAKADELSKESLEIAADQPVAQSGPGAPVNRVANYKDTRGYILLQRSISDPSSDRLRQAVELLQQAAEASKSNETIFKLGIASYALGNKQDGLQKLNVAVVDGQYRPSHELLLLKPLCRDELSAQLEDLLSIEPKRPPGRSSIR